MQAIRGCYVFNFFRLRCLVVSVSESELSDWFAAAPVEEPLPRVLLDVLPSDWDAANVPAALVFSNSLTEVDTKRLKHYTFESQKYTIEIDLHATTMHIMLWWL